MKIKDIKSLRSFGLLHNYIFFTTIIIINQPKRKNNMTEPNDSTRPIMFKTNYSAFYQKQFNDYFIVGDLPNARRVLESMPAPITADEIMARAAVLLQGYRALLDSYDDVLKVEREERTDLEKRMGESIIALDRAQIESNKKL